MPTVEFFFDCSSPWTYLAFHRIQQFAREAGFTVDWRPILVGGVFNAVNESVYDQRDNPVRAKAAYMAKDIRDWARHTGLKIIWPPSIFPVKSVRAMRGCLVAAEHDALPTHARLVFEAYWRDDRDISQLDVLQDLAVAMGLEPAEYRHRIEAPEIKQQLRANTQELIDRGGFGSPTMFVNERDMYFGNDRLELVVAAVQHLSKQT